MPEEDKEVRVGLEEDAAGVAADDADDGGGCGSRCSSAEEAGL